MKVKTMSTISLEDEIDFMYCIGCKFNEKDQCNNPTSNFYQKNISKTNVGLYCFNNETACRIPTEKEVSGCLNCEFTKNGLCTNTDSIMINMPIDEVKKLPLICHSLHFT